MGDPDKSKDFVTKLSLPKFVSMIKRLTPNQRNLVCSIGFEHLLHLCCDYLPHGLIRYLVKQFDSHSRSLKLPDGYPFILSPLTVNKVLGTPIGGKVIGEKVDQNLRLSIAQLTKCQEHYPTINELDKLITPELEGDSFKVVFTLYAMTAFLCPSSHDAVSPYYLHIVRNPKEISSFDYSSAILDKLVSSIDAYNEGSTCVLGGNLLLLMVIYFEFLDSDVIPAPSKSLLPRLSAWSSSLVHDIELMDCVCKNSLQYGRLPIKDVSYTPFALMCNQGQAVRAEKAFDKLMNLILSICPEDQHSVVKDRLPAIMASMYKEIMDTVKPIVIENMTNVLSLVAANQTAPQANIRSIAKSGILQSEVPHLSRIDGCPADVQSSTGLSRSVQNSVPAVVTQQASKAMVLYCARPTPPSAIVIRETADIEDKCEGDVVQMFLLPVPSVELLDKLHEEACKNTAFGSMQSMLDVLKTIPTESVFDIPYNSEVLESLYPQKVAIESMDDCIPSLLEIVSFVLKEEADESELCNTLESKVFFDFEKVSFSHKLDQGCSFSNVPDSMSTKMQCNPNKRSSLILKDNIAEQFVALKKRAKMFEINKEPSTESESVSPAIIAPVLSSQHHGEPTSDRINDTNEHSVALKKKAKDCNINEEQSSHFENDFLAADATTVWSHDLPGSTSGRNVDGNALPIGNTPLFCSRELGEPESSKNDDCIIKSPERFENFDSAWDDEQFDREFLISTLKVEAQFSAYRSNSRLPTQGNPNIHLSEISNVNVIRSDSHYITEDNGNIHISDPSNSDGIGNNSQFISQENQDPTISEVNPNNVISSFSSTLVEVDVFDDIITRVPKTKKAKTKNVVKMGTTWVEHRVFALSMMVYGNVNPYVINMLGKAVMVEDAEKEKLNLLPSGYWKRFYYDYKVAALFMKSCENPGTLSKFLSFNMIGIKLDSRDLVHLPMLTWGFYFLLVVNFKEKVFEVLYPNTKDYLVSDHANVAINNFKMAFKIAYKHSLIDIDNMQIAFRSVCSSERDADSGVYVMELIRNQTGGKILCFQPNHAKPLRESLTYYMLAHPFNELMPPETINILKKHNIPYSYKTTPGYYPWMHEQPQTSSDEIEDMMLF